VAVSTVASTIPPPFSASAPSAPPGCGSDGPSDRFRRRKDVTVHELDGEALLFHPLTANSHRLNATALLIWTACDGRNTAGDIAEQLLSIYEIDLPSALRAVESFLDELRRHDLLEATESGAGPTGISANHPAARGTA